MPISEEIVSHREVPWGQAACSYCHTGLLGNAPHIGHSSCYDLASEAAIGCDADCIGLQKAVSSHVGDTGLLVTCMCPQPRFRPPGT
jgi:hypothetical protein